MSKSRRTKACTFDKGTIARIISRDGDTCIFCASGRWPLVKKDFGAHIRDIAHVVNRSHHQLLDNGNQGLRAEMLEFAECYLKEQYPGWDREKLVYKKGV